MVGTIAITNPLKTEPFEICFWILNGRIIDPHLTCKPLKLYVRSVCYTLDNFSHFLTFLTIVHWNTATLYKEVGCTLFLESNLKPVIGQKSAWSVINLRRKRSHFTFFDLMCWYDSSKRWYLSRVIIECYGTFYFVTVILLDPTWFWKVR